MPIDVTVHLDSANPFRQPSCDLARIRIGNLARTDDEGNTLYLVLNLDESKGFKGVHSRVVAHKREDGFKVLVMKALNALGWRSDA